MSTKTYLGDSVYADWDGYHVVLTTENGAGRPSNTIALDPYVLIALNDYTKKLGQKDVQCADCFEWFDRGDNHTCRQQVKANRRRAKQ